MSYQLSLQEHSKAPKAEIEMPPLPQEVIQEPARAVEQPQQEDQSAVLEQLDQEYSAVEQESAPQESLHQRKNRLDEQSNFREMRAEQRRLREENERLMREIQQKAQPQEEDVREDDIVEGKHLKRYADKLKVLESKIEQSNIELRLKSQYNDFDRVVTVDALNELKDSYPEIYNTIYSSTDLYNKAASAYTLIKKFGIHQSSEHERDKQVAQRNSAKPKPVVSIAPQMGSTPLSQANAFANGLTPELQAALFKEMTDARRDY